MRVIKIKIDFFVEYISKTRTVNLKVFLVCYKSLTKRDLCLMNLLDWWWDVMPLCSYVNQCIAYFWLQGWRKETQFHPYSCFRKVGLQLRTRKHVPCFYRVIETRKDIWENEKCCWNTSRRRVFPQLFRILTNFLLNNYVVRSRFRPRDSWRGRSPSQLSRIEITSE